MIQKMLLYIGLLLPISTMAQKISPKSFDFGKVHDWNNPDAEFVVTNTSSTSFMFLPAGYNPNYFVSTPQGVVEPGAKAVVKVKYFTRTGGKFTLNVPLFISSSQEPIILPVKGVIVSFAPDALTMCPQLTGAGASSSSGQLQVTPEIELVDAVTGQGITDVNLVLYGALQTYAFEHTKKPLLKTRGMQLGLYYIEASKDGYASYSQERYIDKGTFRIRIEMTPVQSSEKREDEDAIAESGTEDEMIVVDNNPYEDKEAIERIRKMMDKKFKGKNIIERDVVVINELERQDTTEIPSTDSSSINSDIDTDGTLNRRKYADNNIVFLIDISGSMAREDKLPLLKIAIKSLVQLLREQDRVTFIVYGTKVEVLLEGARGNEKEKIYAVIDALEAKGQSFGSEGLNAAYNMAKQGYISGGNNQIIIASDGMFNSSGFSEKAIYRQVKQEASDGIILSSIGFGKATSAIKFMKELSVNGRGSFLQILDEEAAKSTLVEEIKRSSLKAR